MDIIIVRYKGVIFLKFQLVKITLALKGVKSCWFKIPAGSISNNDIKSNWIKMNIVIVR